MTTKQINEGAHLIGTKSVKIVPEERLSSLINRAEVRRKLIQQAQDTRFYWKQFEPRVSEDTLAKIEASVSAHIRSIVERLPSKGKTI